jgi:integrase
MRGARPVTADEEARLLASYTGLYHHRDTLFYLLCRWTGARVSQALYLKIRDVYDGRRALDLVYFPRQSRKGKREGQAMPLKPVVQEAVTAWVGDLQRWGLLAPELPLFVSQVRARDGTPKALDRHTATRELQARCEALGFTGRISSHTARKTFARHVYQRSGHNLITCQRALGHANIQTTLSYLSVADEDVFAAILAD